MMPSIINRAGLCLRHLRVNAHLIGVLALSLLLIYPPHLMAQNLDLGIHDEASYAAAIDAIAKSEYVRYDYVSNPRPRIPASVAALMEFATRNPLADEMQLTDFVNAHAAALAAAKPGDPELRRGANLLPALHHTDVTGMPSLEGLDTDIGLKAAAALGLAVPDPLNYDSLENRMVEFMLVHDRQIKYAPEWSELLALGFLGRDIDGADNAALATVLQSFLESEGYEPVPDGIDDERFDLVNSGLDSLPATYSDYLSAITVVPPGEAPPVWDTILAEIDAISANTDSTLAELADANANGPSLLEGYELLQNDPGILDQLDADFRARLDQLATCRTIIDANTLLMAQNADPSVRNLATMSRELTEVRLATWEPAANGLVATLYTGGAIAVFSGVAIIAGTGGAGVFIGLPIIIIGAGMIGAATIILYVRLARRLGLGQAANQEEQAILDQILAARQDIENLRQEMHFRFDRIEMQLNVMYQSIADGLNAIGMQLGEIQGTVEGISRDVMVNRSYLERIEDALYGLAQLLLTTQLASDANAYLNYRPNFGVDLPYSTGGPDTYIDAENAFYTYAVTFAKADPIAGPTTSTLIIPSANETLNGESIGRNINDLRVFPADNLGLPALHASRVVAPGPWAQGAAAYAQCARENPWYFAFLMSGAGASRIQDVIDEGQALADLAVAGRSQALFDALFDGYNDALADFQTATLNHLAADFMIAQGLSNGVTTLDPWGPFGQNVQDLAPPLTNISNSKGELLDLPGAGATSDVWGLFTSDEPETYALLRDVNAQAWGSIPWSSSIPDATVRFCYSLPGGAPGAQRVVVLEALSDPVALWNCANEPRLRTALLSSANLTGQSYATCTAPSTVDVLSDAIRTDLDMTFNAKLTADDAAFGDDFGRSVSVDGETIVVGAWLDGDAGSASGSAYVFTRNAGVWTQEDKLTAADAASGDQFGRSVAVSGDRVVIGAPGENGARGAAYVFVRSGSTWTQEAKLLPNNRFVNDDFGFTVAIDGDTVIVGAPFRDIGGDNDVGAAWAFVRNPIDSTWSFQQRIDKPSPQTDDRFGWAVSIAGDTALIGSQGDSVGGSGSDGSAYVFIRSGTTWTQLGARLETPLPDGPQDNDNFGSAVSTDGSAHAIGGVWNTGTPQAPLFEDNGSGWSHVASALPPPSDPSGGFSQAVAIDDDWLIAGQTGRLSNTGAAYAFPEGWFDTNDGLQLIAPDATPEAFFGASISVCAGTAVVGAPDADDGAISEPGAAYVYTSSPSPLETLIAQQLAVVQIDALNSLIPELQSPGSNTLKDAAERISDWESLIQAYATLSLPFAMECSTVLRSGLGGNPQTSELSLSGDAVLPALQRMLSGEEAQTSIEGIFRQRSAIAQQEINDALAADPQGHPYIDFMLAELKDMRDHAFDLAAPDTYMTAPDTTLDVLADDGLLANDTLQLYRIVTVDTDFAFEPEFVAPKHGDLTLNSDGSFTYDPDPGFIGTDSFTYRTMCNVLAAPDYAVGAVGDTYSNPATVVILVSADAPTSCPGDGNGDNMVDIQDLNLVLGNFQQSGAPGIPGDLNGDGVVNIADLNSVLGNFQNSCAG